MRFEPGAAPAGFIPLCVPEIRGREWEYVKQCLDTGWVSSVGSFVDRFERQVAERIGAAHAVATVNGTAALHVALQVVGVRAGDEVLVSDLTFIAPANAVRYAGAWPVFIDAEPGYWQMDLQKASDFLARECVRRDGALRNRSTGRPVRAILPVHALGHPCDVDAVVELARRYGLAVIEDAAEGLGARYKGRPVGRPADVACFSFNGNKIVTCGGGGMIVTDNAEWAAKARYLTTQAKDDPVEYVHGEIGYNHRLTNLQAAVGVAQMEVLDDYVAAKRRIAREYGARLAGVPGLTPMPEAPWAFGTSWMYTVLVDEARFGMDSRSLLRRLHEARIQARPLWQPMHRSPAHAGAPTTECGVSDRLSAQALSLPCSVGLTDPQLSAVVESIKGLHAATQESGAAEQAAR